MGRCLSNVILCVTVLLSVPSAFAQTDVEGSKDYPGISRMPGYYIRDYRDTSFDSNEFTISEAGNEKRLTVEGHRFDILYHLKDNATPPSALQIVRNYQNAARAVGGTILFDTRDATTIRFNKADKEVWLSLEVGNEPSGTPINMVIIEKQAMRQEVTMDANAMARDISATGRVAIYGILFDTGKADLKPESGPALAEIAKLFKANTTLKVYVVGHTDMTADLATNLKLSQARAQSVVNALVNQYGIIATRLIPFGAGPYAPVASNKTDECRAKNRRVELVEIATK